MNDSAQNRAQNRLQNDPVNHPAHYTSGSIEVIDFLEDQRFGFHLANAVKYICRAGKKDAAKTVEDLRKAVWYINRYIGLLEKNSAGAPSSETDCLSSALIRAEKGGEV